MNASELRDIIAWMIGGARSAPTPAQMMAECCERLVRAGLPLWRVWRAAWWERRRSPT